MALLAASVGFASVAKNTLRLPRPYFLSQSVTRRDPTVETSYACPSGHTVVMAVMMYLALELRAHYWYAVAIVAIMGTSHAFVPI